QAWNGTHVSRAALKVCVRAIRVALDDDAESPRYLETVGREGYRFLCGTVVPERHAADGVDERPVVGRDGVVAQLVRWAARARQGHRQLVFDTGEPGIGKTTVVDLFLERVGVEEPLWLARGQCLEQYGEGEPYLPVLEALWQLCRAPGGPRTIDLLRRFAPTWLAQMPALVPESDNEA